MSSGKQIYLPEVGQVTVSKRSGSRNLRLSISSQGAVRVNLPTWVPYAAGFQFVAKNTDWIAKHRARLAPIDLYDGCRIGKARRLYFVHDKSLGAKVNIKTTERAVMATSGLPIEDRLVQTKLRTSCEQALKAEAQAILPDRLAELSRRFGYKYHQIKIRKLISRWGSCSSGGSITLNSYLMQLPWRLIDYVILHELAHTAHMHHGPDFWAELENASPTSRRLRQELKQWRPQLLPQVA